METSCVSCKKYTSNKNSSVRKTNQKGIMVLSNCALWQEKNQLLLKTKKSTILIIFQMISLKRMKS